ncbi:MAG: Flp pilus assembly protein CpaB [Polyangiales bacterium]
MNRKVLIVAALVGVLGAFLLMAYLRRFEIEASGGALVNVIAARKQIEPGTVVTEELLTTQKIPQAYVESRAVRETEKAKILGLRVSTPVQAQQTMMWTDLAITSDDRRDLSALVQPGMRAVGVRASNDDKSFALIHPGDRVDVIGSMPQAGGDTRIATVLLQNVLVLAVGLDTGNEPTPSADKRHDRELLLHLSLNLPEAQLLALASDKGRIFVALRNPDDVRVTDGIADLSSKILTDPKDRKAVQDGRRAPSAPVKLPSQGAAQ